MESLNTNENNTTIKADAAQAVSEAKNILESSVTANGTTNGNTAGTSPNTVVEPVAGPSSGEPKSIENVKLAMQHLAAGKRDLLISDPNAAVASLALACELLGEHYGETAYECGEAYYFYGRALLDLARLEAGVIENLDGDGESEENSVEGDEQEASPETPTEGEKQSDGEKEKVENETIGSEDKEANAVKDQGDAQEVEKEDEEDPSNLQLAWEMLELAKTILVKQAESIKVVDSQDAKDAEEKAKLKDDVESRVSETFQTLGELSIENENYPQAIEDLETCLKRRQDMMPDDSRSIAETHYQLGVAQGFNLQFDDAVTSLEGAIHVLEVRVDKLKAKTESIDPTKAKDAFYTRENEIKEIESLIPEIREKIADTKDMKTETFKKLGDKRLMEEGIAANLGATTENGDLNGGSNKFATTISSSLIKKRPATDSGAGDAKKMHIKENTTDSGAADAKKIHIEENTTDHTPATGNGAKENGVAKEIST